MSEIEYRTFECSVEECSCEFGNSHDLKVHMNSGQHGRIGDRFAEQNRRKFKYFTRQGRVKEDMYRKEAGSKEQENNGQEHLSS